jgi:Uncharacterized protein conserved in bacteria (DUF2219)
LPSSFRRCARASGFILSAFPSVKRNAFGHDLQLGLAATWGKSRVGFTFVTRSKEFETQSADDKFGQLTISFAV